jgi:hypothetical protein
MMGGIPLSNGYVQTSSLPPTFEPLALEYILTKFESFVWSQWENTVLNLRYLRFIPKNALPQFSVIKLSFGFFWFHPKYSHAMCHKN